MKRFLLACVILSFLLAACGAGGIGGPTPTPTELPASFKIEITVLGENPRPVGGMAMGLGVTPNVDAPNTNITITMPSDTSLLTGSQAWSGDLKANQGIYLNLTVILPALTKPAEIKIDAASYPTGKSKISKTASLYMRPAPDGKIEISTTPFK